MMARKRWLAPMAALLAGVAFAAEACSASDPVVPSVDAATDVVVPTPVPDASAPDASTDGRADADPCAPAGPPQCSPSAAWGPAVPVTGGPGGRFAAVTYDELHMAWLETAAEAGAGATVRVADRASTNDGFPSGAVAMDAVDVAGVGLTHDGLGLLVTRAGQPFLSTRSSMTTPFGPPKSEAFFVGGEAAYAAPVASESGAFLALVYSSPGQVPFAYAGRIDGVYKLTELLVPSADLVVTRPGSAGPRPTGVSKDLRTLFFWDDVKRVERAAFRAAKGCPYDTVVDLGAMPGAQPNADCSALYFSDPANDGKPARVARKP